MKEIKFRGQRTDTKEWVYGFYAKTVTSEEVNCVADCRKHDIIIDEHGTFWYVIPETVGQYTGLKDGNGKEIYVGDIVRDNSLSDDKDYIYEIVFEDGAFISKWLGDFDNYLYEVQGELEIINNIYENLEMVLR